jgi:hypothetical protein
VRTYQRRHRSCGCDTRWNAPAGTAVDDHDQARPSRRRRAAGANASSGLVWRVARRYKTAVVRQISEADVGRSVVLVFSVVGRGETSLVFALTRGDTSSKAVKAITHEIHSV